MTLSKFIFLYSYNNQIYVVLAEIDTEISEIGPNMNSHLKQIEINSVKETIFSRNGARAVGLLVKEIKFHQNFSHDNKS